MSISFSQITDVTCRQCSHTFPFEIWLIVAADERPDLLAQICAGALHVLTCPQCGHSEKQEAPLLIFRPQSNTPLIFSPAKPDTDNDTREQAAGFVQVLRYRVYDDWHDSWSSDTVSIVQHQKLSVALASAPEIVFHKNLASKQKTGTPFQKIPSQLDSWRAEAQQLDERFIQLYDPRVLNLAIESWSKIVDHTQFATTPLNFRLLVLNDAGRAFHLRYQAQGDSADLDRALKLWTEAVHTTLPDSPNQPMYLNNLGTGLSARYERTGRLEDLEQALAVFQQAVQTTPLNSPDLPSRLNNLGNGLSFRYAQTGRLEDLEQALAVFQQAVQLTPLNSPDLPSRLNNLGNGLSFRYAQTGRLEDLEQALAVFQQAVQATPPHSLDRPGCLTNLGNGLSTRYARMGQLDDLEQAISRFKQAIQTTPPNSPALPSILNNLGTGLRTRYARMGHLEDLEQALAVYQQAVQATPPHSLDRPSIFNNLGTGLSTLYARTGRLEDLEQAISYFEQVIQTAPPASPDWSGYLTNLGAGLSARYARMGQLDDLEQAISRFKQAIQTTPPNSPALPSILNNLGTGLRDRYARTGRLEDLEQAQTSYATACEQGQLLAPEVALIAAQSWGRWASERTVWDEAVRAFEAGLATIEQLHRTQLRRSESEAWLSEARGLHMRAAYALVQTGTPVAHRRAVEVAEIGRARGLGETLARDRSDLSEIQQASPDTYERYRADAELVRQYERADRTTTQRTAPSGITHTPNLAALILAAREQLDTVVDEIRSLPGYGGFLRAPTYAEIVATARPEMPLVYLLTTVQGSLALIVSSQAKEPTALLIDSFTESQLQTLLITREGDEVVGGYLPGQFGDHIMLSAALDTALPLLGNQLIAPLAAQLRAMGAHGVTLIPTGLLSLLPLHAATYAVGGETCCLLDEFDVAYAPSARVLATAQREAQQRQGAPRLTGVGNPTRDLRYAGPELAAICDLLPTGAAAPFYETQARRAALWQALPEATIAHLSCHGSFANDPLDTALYLAGDDRITLRELVTGDTSALAKLRLVVMSACQTALTDFQRVPDESIGLPGGFLQAGVPAVVGTLWSVDDLSTALLMHRFYELYLQGDSAAGMGLQPPARALRLAQRWLRDLSYQEMYDYFVQHAELAQAGLDTASSTRMPGNLIDEGMLRAEQGAIKTPTARPYTHPFAWAAFTFSGAMEAINGW